MQLLQCPECKRSFREPGFCPYDGRQLSDVPNDEKLTIASAHVSVQTPPYTKHPTEIDERRGTFPLTPSVSSGVHRLPPGAPTQATAAVAVQPSVPPSRASVPLMTQTGHPQSSPPPLSQPPPVSQPPSYSVQLDNSQTNVRAISGQQKSVTEAIALMTHDTRSEYDRLVGEVLEGRYKVQRKIGEGGMGVVFAVKHSVIERPLAIKVLKREVMRDAGTIRRFVQEAKAASRIGHPNIVDVTDFGQTPEGLTYSVMEYVDGQTLSYAIRHGAPFHIARALRIAAQIARALGTAHDKGIVHRDLKPENVFLLDRDGRPDFVKIVDFGIAKVAPPPNAPNEPRLTKAGAVFGTPEYMAPEQAAGRSDTDGRVDVYALGVILYEMIVGRVPHKGDTMVRTLAMQMLDAIVPPSVARPDLNIPIEVETVMLKALAKKRDARYQTMGELLEALDELARDVLPPPVAHNAAGSAVYALAPLPPGADPSVVQPMPVNMMPIPVVSPTPVGAAPSAQMAAETSGRMMAAVPATPTQRRLHEPQFVSAHHDLPVYDAPEPARQSGARWPIIIGGVLGLGAIAGAAAFALTRDSSNSNAAPPPKTDPVVAQVDAGAKQNPVVADAAPVVDTPPDAAVVADLDAGNDTPPPPADAAVLVVVPRDAGRQNHNPDNIHDPNPHPHPHPTDAGVPVVRDAAPQLTIDPTKKVGVTIMTKPETARLFDGTTYRGPGGVTIDEAVGTVKDLECRAAGYKPGHVHVVWDGGTEAVLCVMTRIKICIDNIKNPFDDCEIDPTRPSPDPTVGH